MRPQSRQSNTSPRGVDSFTLRVLVTVFILLALLLAGTLYTGSPTQAWAQALPAASVGTGATPTAAVSAPPGGRVRAALARPNVLVVTFEGAAVAMTEDGARSFNEAMEPMGSWLKGSHAEVLASAPAGDTADGQTLSFYRAMTVRNLLLDQGLPPARIQVRVSDTPLAGDVGVVRVSFGPAPREVKP